MSILTALKDLTDPRRSQAKQYEMSDVLFCMVLASICNANSYRESHIFITENFTYLKRKLKLNWKNPPDYTTLRNIVVLVDPVELNNVLEKHVKDFLTFVNSSSNHIAIDGKTIRGSYNYTKNTNATHLLNVFIANFGIVQNQINVSFEKTNEIPIAQKYIDKTQEKGKIFSLDALHCQKNTVRNTLLSGNDLLIQVKANQKNLLRKCKERTYIQRNYLTYSKIEKGHGRIEKREVTTYYNVNSSLPKGFKTFSTLIHVRRYRNKLNTLEGNYKKSVEDSYYLCSRVVDAKEGYNLTRNHWSIENSLHNVLDQSYKEDTSRIRINPQAMSLIRCFSLNILRMNRVKNIKSGRFTLGQNRYKLAKLKFLWN